MLSILSWDCAYKTLGWATITVNTNVHEENARLAREVERARIAGDPEAQYAAMVAQEKCLSTWLQITGMGVDDILPGKKVKDVNTIERARALRDYLVSRPHASATYDMVLIEGQPPALTSEFAKKVNTGSTAVAQQLIFHYIDQNCRTISPRKKNGVCLSPQLDFLTWSGGVNNYKLRKDHTVACLAFLRLYMTPETRIKCDQIPAGILNNAADAVMQVMAILPEVSVARGHLTRRQACLPR